MNYFAGGIAALQERKRLIRGSESFNSTIFVYDAPIPGRHKATISRFLNLMRRPLRDVELNRCVLGFVVLVGHDRFVFPPGASFSPKASSSDSRAMRSCASAKFLMRYSYSPSRSGSFAVTT